jgi:hypothetical protein
VSSPDPSQVAERLGLPQEAVRRIQRRGFLWRLDLDRREIRERLWRGHITSSRAAPAATWQRTIEKELRASSTDDHRSSGQLQEVRPCPLQSSVASSRLRLEPADRGSAASRAALAFDS